jgi:hypothetical protein
MHLVRSISHINSLSAFHCGGGGALRRE